MKLKIYGGRKGKLYSVMIADRNKGTGELTFPKLLEKETWEWSDRWDEMHRETAAYHAACHRQFRDFGFIASPILDTRKRYFPGGAADDENAIANLPIQGGAASLMNRALLIIAEKIGFRKWSRWSGPVYQVHDYVGVVVPEGRALEAKSIIEKAMYYVYNDVAFTATADITWTFGQQ